MSACARGRLLVAIQIARNGLVIGRSFETTLMTPRHVPPKDMLQRAYAPTLPSVLETRGDAIHRQEKQPLAPLLCSTRGSLPEGTEGAELQVREGVHVWIA
jgi:hypothetical protein